MISFKIKKKPVKLPADSRYLVHPDGRVFSTVNQIFLKQRLNHKGYPYILLNRKVLLIHRAVAICFKPNPKNLPQVNHEDGDKLNNNHWNLSWVTPKQNKEHAMKNGLYYIPKGSKNGNHKLTDAQVRQIKKLLDKGKLTQWEIANRYGVRQCTISSIKRGKLRKES